MGAFACCAAKESDFDKRDGLTAEEMEWREAMPDIVVTVEREDAYPRFVQITVKAWEQVTTSMLRGLSLRAEDWTVGSVWLGEELIDITRDWEVAGITENDHIVKARIVERTEPIHQTVMTTGDVSTPCDARLSSKFAPRNPSDAMSVLEI